MKKEKSCGAVVYKIQNGEFYFLLEFMSLGHISLPKGHVEENESEIETAYREIKEETALEVEIDSNFHETITYSPSKDVIKDVVFFVALTREDTLPIDLHDDEVKDSRFYKYEDALNLLTFASDKEVLSKAYFYLRGKNE